MKYFRITEGIFLSRPNRFIARVEAGGEVFSVHVKNTGRCAELLIPGARVILSVPESMEGRKTPFDLIAVEKVTPHGAVLVNMDSQAPNACAAEWLSGGFFPAGTLLRSEVKYKNSRFDFFAPEEKCFVEVKGVTLEEDGVALFPDAPTVRGTKHLSELVCALEEGYRAAVLFVIQMKGVREFRPNAERDPDFAAALLRARDAGVEIVAVDCVAGEDFLTVDSFVPVVL